MSGRGHPYAAVVARFVHGLPERRRSMAAAVGELDGARPDQAAETLRQEAHRIAGTAGSLGFSTLGALALELERAVEAGVPVTDLRRCHQQVETAAMGLRVADSTLLAPDGGMRNPGAPSA